MRQRVTVLTIRCAGNCWLADVTRHVRLGRFLETSYRKPPDTDSTTYTFGQQWQLLDWKWLEDAPPLVSFAVRMKCTHGSVMRSEEWLRDVLATGVSNEVVAVSPD